MPEGPPAAVRPAARAAHATAETAALLLLLLPPAWAADPAPPPNAGTLLRDLQRPTAPAPRPAPETVLPAEPGKGPARSGADTGETFVLQGVVFTGATVFAPAQLQALVAGRIGKPIGLAGLQALADDITQHYRQAGYPLASAVLPAQDIADGRVQIQLLEGRLGALSLRGPARTAQATLPLAALKPGEVLADAALERALLLTNDLPGIRVRSTLQPGASVGTTDLVVELLPERPVAGTVDADNHGSAGTGARRTSASLSLNNPSGLGDVLNLRAMGSEAGLARYGRLSWQLPVNQQGTRVGLAASEMTYRLGRDFAALQAQGSARIGSLFASHPLLRSRQANASLQLLADDKHLRDTVGATETTADKTVRLLALGLSADRVDALWGGGQTSAQATLSNGRLNLGSEEARAVDAASAQTAGSFSKLVLVLQRQQLLPVGAGNTSLALQLTGQWSGTNLDSSEKMALGGVGGVRAYRSGESPADQAALLAVELRHRFSATWQASAFADAAQGRTNAEPWAEGSGNTRHLYGAGLGLEWAPGAGFTLQLQVAQRLGPQPANSTAGHTRSWVQLQWEPR